MKMIKPQKHKPLRARSAYYEGKAKKVENNTVREDIEICLNCKKKKCLGECDKVKGVRR